MKKYLIYVLILSVGFTAVVCASRVKSSVVKLNYIDTGLEYKPVIVFYTWRNFIFARMGSCYG